jgi:hypothetical protein
LNGYRRVRRFTPINRKHPAYRPFREMLGELYQRYRRPIFIAETGSENRIRASWFRYVCEETRAAMEAGVPVQGMCLYPILNHPGWVDGRHCLNGLWDYPDANGQREIYEPLARELRRWQKVFERNGKPTGTLATASSMENATHEANSKSMSGNFEFRISEL